MCGRFTLTVTMEELLLLYDTEYNTVSFHLPRFNIAPGQPIAAVVNDGEQNRIGPLMWGLVPSWASSPDIGRKMINARAETLTEKPAFKRLITSKRCIIPADGFYEWKKENEKKQPMRIRLKSGKLFGMAGLYDTWRGPDGTILHTCTVITTRPNRLMEPIHHRMPVILDQEGQALWLDRNCRDTAELVSILNPYSSDDMEAYPVSSRVGNVRNDDQDLIKPISRS